VIRRPYTMQNIRRHTEIDVPVDIHLLDGIKHLS
jgi:hypothetical protein